MSNSQKRKITPKFTDQPAKGDSYAINEGNDDVHNDSSIGFLAQRAETQNYVREDQGSQSERNYDKNMDSPSHSPNYDESNIGSMDRK